MELARALLEHGHVVTDNSPASRALVTKKFGTRRADGRVLLTPFEALYLLEEKEIVVFQNKKTVSFTHLLRALGKAKTFWTSYVVFRHLRNKEFIVKTGLKFGTDFRVYPKGATPKTHATWLVMPVRERDNIRAIDFAAKNRIANTANKHILLAIVDDEDDVSLWDVTWLKQ